MRALTTVAIGLALLLASYGCGGAPGERAGAQGEAAEAAAPASPQQGLVETAAAIAREIEASPDQAEAILQRHGTTRQEFETMLYDIAADPDLSRAYTEALER